MSSQSAPESPTRRSVPQAELSPAPLPAATPDHGHPGQPTPESARTPEWQSLGLPTTTRFQLLAPERRALGPYRLESLLAEGGMGLVYVARHAQTGQRVALKTLRSGIHQHPDALARFEREVSACKIPHEYIVPIWDVGSDAGRPYFTMPLLPATLAQRRSQYWADPKAAALLVRRVAAGIAVAHARGVLHRDLKPANILLTEAGVPQIADFGLAKLYTQLESRSLTSTGQMLGTPGYMAPEQTSRQFGPVGPGTDIWALGVILYELLTKHRPFDGDTREATLERIRADEPTPISEFSPSADPDLIAIVERCLQKEPRDRYPSADALGEDLDRWLAGGKPSSLGDYRARQWRNRLRAPAVLCGGLLAVLLATLAIAPKPVADDAGIDWSTPIPTVEKKRWIEQRLAEGKTVDLISARGELRYPPLTYPKQTTVAVTPVGVQFATATSHAFVELYDALPPHYEYEVEMRYAGGPGIQLRCGVCVGVQTRLVNSSNNRNAGANAEPQQLGTIYTFAGGGDTSKGGRRLPSAIKLCFAKRIEPGMTSQKDLNLLPNNRFKFPVPDAPDDGGFVRLKIRVDSDGSHFYWYDREIGCLDDSDLDRNANSVRVVHNWNFSPEQMLHGSCGIFLDRSAVSVRRPTLRRLP